MPPITKTFHASTRKDWRDWLRRNHRRESFIWLVRHRKNTKKPTFNQSDAMDEAICFGWIDTVLKRVDDERYAVRFVKRGPKSRWSNATLGRARRLITAKKMAAAGLKAYEEGLKKPVIDHGLPRNPDTPEDLKKALSRSKAATANFSNFPPSARRYYIWWILRAKREDTRKRRVAEVYRLVKEGKKPGAV